MFTFSLYMKIRTVEQNFMKFYYQRVYWTSFIDTLQRWLKSNSNNGHITWRTYMHFCAHLKHNSVKFIKEKNERHFVIHTLFPLILMLFMVTKQNLMLDVPSNFMSICLNCLFNAMMSKGATHNLQISKKTVNTSELWH